MCISSVAQSCLTLCDPVSHSTPGLPVHHQLPEFTQTHVHRVGDAIQPFYPLPSPSPPAPNPSQHQGLCVYATLQKKICPCPNVLVAQMVKKNHLPMQETQEIQVPALSQEYPLEGNGNPFQYSWLENSMDRGASWATVHGVTESDMTEPLITFTF